jgi:hypothetical protein
MKEGLSVEKGKVNGGGRFKCSGKRRMGPLIQGTSNIVLGATRAQF